MSKTETKNKSRFYPSKFWFLYCDIFGNNLPSFNVAESVLSAIKGHKVLCMEIMLKGYKKPDKHFYLPVGYKKREFRQMLHYMRYYWYTCLYANITMSGIIWCTDGVWFQRVVGDGYEYWVKHERPEIPTYLKNDKL